MDATQRFYDELASDYHLIYADWDASIRWQGGFIARWLPETGRVLDIACGMGTQSIGLALEGFEVVGRDLSPKFIERAALEARRLGAAAKFDIGDMRRRVPADAGAFAAVIAFDNALPHLESEDLAATLDVARTALGPGGVFLASIRDYDELLNARPQFDPPRLLGHGPDERIVLQLWTWLDDRRYRLEHMILTRDGEAGWTTRVRVGSYRAILRAELSQLLTEHGFGDVSWKLPAESGFYQPVVRAIRS